MANAEVDDYLERLCVKSNILERPPEQWGVDDLAQWLHGEFSQKFIGMIREENVDGKAFLDLNEEDIRNIRYQGGYNIKIGEMKKIYRAICELRMHNKLLLSRLVLKPEYDENSIEKHMFLRSHSPKRNNLYTVDGLSMKTQVEPGIIFEKSELLVPTAKVTGLGTKCIPPDVFKTALSLGYSFLVTWITSFVMVIVHERVPDMKRYPPLPDIFLDNVPHIPWAFHMCEITGTLLFLIWSCVCIFHKHRLVLLRRFFALAGTVFLLRCVTMLITSLSVPGTHLQCNQKDYAVDDTSMSFLDSLEVRISRAYSIWSGLGMSIQGVRTCGDYMFSGHTVALTLLNFFITEYTPRNLYFLHTLTWLLNMFGIFFILAAHEHYSIDVFVAFYITSRLFLYYHTLANNQALMSRDSNRTRIWFPMFSYFESSVEGIIPNEYDSFSSLFRLFKISIIYIKDTIIFLVQRIWVESHKMTAKNNMNSDITKRNQVKDIYQSNKRSEHHRNEEDLRNRLREINETSSVHQKEINESTDLKKFQ